MVFLGFGKYARADKIYALEPLVGRRARRRAPDARVGRGRRRATRRLANRAHDPPRNGPRRRRLGAARRCASTSRSASRLPRRRVASTSPTSGVAHDVCSRRPRGPPRPSRCSDHADRGFFARDARRRRARARRLDAPRRRRRRRDRRDRGVRAGRSGEPLLRRVGRAATRRCSGLRAALRLPLVRDPLVRERRLRGRRRRRGGAPPRARAHVGNRPDADAARARRRAPALRPGPGRLTQALGLTGDARRARRSTARRSSSSSPARPVQTSSRRRASGSRAASTGLALLARGLYVREPSPTTSADAEPGRDGDTGPRALAENRSGVPRRGHDSQLAASGAPPRAARPRGSSRRSSGATRVAPSRPRCVTESCAESPPRARILVDDDARAACPASRARTRPRAPSGCAARRASAPCLRSSRRRAAPRPRSACSRPPSSGLSPGEVRDEPRSAAVAVVELPLAVALARPRSTRRPGTAASRTITSSSSSTFSTNAFQIMRGQRSRRRRARRRTR